MNGNASSCEETACSDELSTGNVTPILNEIRHALKKLLEEGEPTIIDLRALPMGPGEELQLESLLGIGEVTANIDAMGPSTVNETLFAGVWLVTHRNTEDAILGKFIEITHYPSILESQTADIRSALKALPDLLTENG
ncbi:MAG: hydrogenase expression/formation C-terminal domain-containing protein [Arenicellales bacterium]